MKPSIPTNTTPVLTDKDPNPDAQMPLETEEAKQEDPSVLIGGGVVVGASLGAVAGTLGSAAAGAAMSPDKESTPQVAALFRTPAR